MSHASDIYQAGSVPSHMFSSTLRRGRGAITVWPGAVAGRAEVLLVEAAPGHAAADWALLAARHGGAR